MRLSFLVILLFCQSAWSQTVYHQNVYWLRYQTQLVFNDNWQWNNEIDNRRFFNPDVQHQFIFHSRVHYRSGRWNFGVGFTTSAAYASRPEFVVSHPVTEIRPVVEASYEIPTRRLLLQQRIRFDSRFFEEDRFDGLNGTYDFVGRLRYRIQARFALKKNKENLQTIGMRLADEVMVNTKDNFFDQQRVYVSVDSRLSNRFTLETDYIHIYQQRRGVEEFFSRNVLRISLLHRIKA
jgi:hypothetical protein